jgi:hypothetical protein
MKSLEQLKNELHQFGNQTVDYEVLAEFIKMRNLLVHNLMLTTNFLKEFTTNGSLLTEIKESFRAVADAAEAWNQVTLLNFGLSTGLSPEQALQQFNQSKELSIEEQGNEDIRVQMRGHISHLRELRERRQANKTLHPTAGNAPV